MTGVDQDWLCRDCGHVAEASAQAWCPVCGSARGVHHAELSALTLAHVDCDAFFAAVEKRDDPSLVDKPVIVGGGRRGVVSTCCYIARTYGIRSAMPMFKALERCPHAIVVKPSYEKYKDAALKVRALFDQLTPLVQPISIDEAFLDLGGTARLHGAPAASVLARLALDVETEIGVTVSVGLAPNKFLAKIASELDKPRGFAVIGEAETPTFLADKPVDLIPGIGASFAGKLRKEGVHQLADLQRADPKALARRFGESAFRLVDLAHGRDTRPVRTERAPKSISGETTFGADITSTEGLEDRLYAMAQKVTRRAKAQGYAGRVVTLKLKTATFRSLTRRQTLTTPTNLTQILYDTGKTLLHDELTSRKQYTAYRLIGISLSDLVDADDMDGGGLFSNDLDRLKARESAVDALRARFGDSAIGTERDRRVAYRNR